jgi:SAM-dependent methyltransferase
MQMLALRQVSDDLTVKESWETVVRPLLNAPAEALWRAHSDAVNAALLARWLPSETCRFLLKTELFDEAIGEGLYPLLAMRADSVAALDLAPSVLAAAVARYPQLLAVTADVRRLPFGSETLEIIVSNSTLDHFETSHEITSALRELFRVLRRGGRLLLTMDNLANPAVAIRNVLPFRLLRRLGLASYPFGATGGRRRLTRLLREVGFEVEETVALLHCPRVLAVPIARRLQRRGTAAKRTRFLRRLQSWERLANLPTRYLTGYFVGVDARKP